MVNKNNNNEFQAVFLRALFAPPYFINKIEIRKNVIILSGLFKKYTLKTNKLIVKRYKNAFAGPADTFVVQYDKKRFVFDSFYFKGAWTNALSKSVKISRNGSYNPGNRVLLGLLFAVIGILVLKFFEIGNLYILGTAIIVLIFFICYAADPYK